MFVSQIACLIAPRLELSVVVTDQADLFQHPLALAPANSANGKRQIGQVSGVAEAHGVTAGMPLAQALALCPSLRLLPANPVAANQRWEQLIQALESLGAKVDASGPIGTLWFSLRVVHRLFSNSTEETLKAIRQKLGIGLQIGLGPSKFLSFVAARRATVKHHLSISSAADIAPAPIDQLGAADSRFATLVPNLNRLGIETIGDFKKLNRGQVGERFGAIGLDAYELCHGACQALKTREAKDLVVAKLELEEANSGPQLQHALSLLLDQIHAKKQLNGLLLQTILLEAKLVNGGSWQHQVVFRKPTRDRETLQIATAPHLNEIPAPATAIRVTVTATVAMDQQSETLLDWQKTTRLNKLELAISQVRQVAGSNGALRVVEVDPNSRLSERLSALTPFEL